MIVGSGSIWSLIYFEFCRLLAPFPGALGIVLRKLFWPGLFASCGKGVVFGSNISLMCPGKMEIGRKVVLGDNCILDARSATGDPCLRIADHVMLSHGVMMSCKNGAISVGERCGIGAYTVIQSTGAAEAQNAVRIGEDTVIGVRCYIAGGGNYNVDRLDVPIAQQGVRDMGGTRIGRGVWLGASASVLGGVEVGDDAIVGAGAVVARTLPPRSVSFGVPARVQRIRGESEEAKAETST
ncbi:acyltransferase [Tropicimonas aquimaris]|uniref:Acyltransferase n=1 Tax=Tropicimonas aquimaris TaxID=914152 RepID=A0ABW3ISQ7_9RHOB